MKEHPVLKETLTMLLGEAIVSVLTVLAYIILSATVLPGVFSWRVITGVLLGAFVICLNYFLLARATNRAFDKAEAERGNREMNEDEIREFTEKHKLRLQAILLRSQGLRTVTMLAALILAFVLPCFDGVAALVPLLMFRPILLLKEFIGKKVSHGES